MLWTAVSMALHSYRHTVVRLVCRIMHESQPIEPHRLRLLVAPSRVACPQTRTCSVFKVRACSPIVRLHRSMSRPRHYYPCPAEPPLCHEKIEKGERRTRSGREPVALRRPQPPNTPRDIAALPDHFDGTFAGTCNSSSGLRLSSYYPGIYILGREDTKMNALATNNRCGV